MSAAEAKPDRRSVGQVLKDAVLFLAAPFISLAYMALFPFIGIAMLMRNRREKRNQQRASS